MKFIFFAMEAYPFPIAKHLSDEGYDVTIGIINSYKDLMIPDSNVKETMEAKNRRFSVYTGIMKKKSAVELMADLRRVPRKEQDDYFIFFDYNNTYNLSQQVLKMGFRNGLFPTEFYYKMEKERHMAKDFVKKFYDDVIVADSFDFKSAKDGIKFLQDSEDKVYVLKSNGNHGKTIVPRSDDAEKGKKVLIEALEKNKKEYEAGGFLLEEKIPNCQEVTPVMVFYDGVPVYSLVEFECKEFGAGNIGPQKGGNLALSVKTELDCEINRISFPKAIYDLAKKQPGLAVFDIGLLYNGEDFYFTEFCAMRYGWDGIFSEIVMRDDGYQFVGAYFEDLKAKRNPLVNKYGASVRLFNLNGKGEETEGCEDDLSVSWDGGLENNIFMYQIKKKAGKIVSVGGFDLLGVATGASNVLETAVGKAYEVVNSVEFEKLYYRPKFDFLSMDYKSSILNRLSAMKPFIESE